MIIRCASRRAPIRALTRCRASACAQRGGVFACRKRFFQSAFATSPDNERLPAIKSHHYDVFRRFKYPVRERIGDPSAWTELLEACLPPHLRQHPDVSVDSVEDVTHIAQILVAAQRASEEQSIAGEGVDLLFHLGVTEGRWPAVVWLVKRLVESFGGQGLHKVPQPNSIFTWRSEQSLYQLTNNEIDIGRDIVLSKADSTSANRKFTLDEFTRNTDQKQEFQEALRRDCLGQIWRSLAQMTMACVDEGMKPEVLEIIAYLHHMEVMPMSIYNQRPSPDSTAIQQPPILRLFSSRILTSLSDAAWRAHEKQVVQEAKAKGGDYTSIRPEIPGMAYRVHVAGLRPEVWMELILWSCLHGGWVVEGVKILRMLCQEPTAREWRPFSWRSLVPAEGSETDDWDKFDFIFNTKPNSEITQAGTKSITQIHRTISSEVVNAYVDATLTVMRPAFGQRGMSPAQALRQLRFMKRLLDRSGLSLSTGSWDAILVRFIDQQPHVIDRRIHFDRFIVLSPIMGTELASDNGRNLPDYVMDGSAAVLGLFHQALLARIKAGDVEGAFRLFQALQERADTNKHQSIVDFLSKQASQHESSRAQEELFSSHFSGIDYPVFDLQIPPTTLGPFLDLVTDAKAYDFGRWLLNSYDLDGPVIPERLYGDPAVAPVLVRFAAETGDKGLLAKLVRARADLAKPGEPELPGNVLQSFLDSQVNLRRWNATDRILQHMDMRYTYWNPVNLAHIARVMLSAYRDASYSTPGSDFERAKGLFGEMVSGRYKRAWERYKAEITMLVTMVATLDSHWANYCLDLNCLGGHHNFSLPAKAFNLALEGAVRAYGFAAGRRVLDLFWPRSVRNALRPDWTSFENSSEEPRTVEYSPFVLDSVVRKRNVIRIRGHREENVVIYGGLHPDLMTIRIIFRKALEELRDGASIENQAGFAWSEADLAHEPMSADDIDLTESGVIVWAIRCLRTLQMVDEDILAELEASLDARDMSHIKARLPAMFEQVDEAGTEDVNVDAKYEVYNT